MAGQNQEMDLVSRNPKGSKYDISTYHFLICMINVGKYIIHGCFDPLSFLDGTFFAIMEMETDPCSPPNSTPNFLQAPWFNRKISVQYLSCPSVSDPQSSIWVDFFWRNPRKNWSPEFKNHKKKRFHTMYIIKYINIYIYIYTRWIFTPIVQ